jgi:PAS domain S-box-containing protein
MRNSPPAVPDSANAAAGLDNIRDLMPALFEALADAVVIVDRERRVVAANRRHAETFGAGRVDLIGGDCTEQRHHPEPRAGRQRCVLCETIETRSLQRRIVRLPDATGAMRRFEATFSPILDGSGAVAHVVEVWRDVTDRTELEVQLSHSERLASVGILAAGVAHEINNPLASMMAGIEGLGRWLKRGQFDEEGVREAVTTIELLEREIERGRQTTEKLMLLGRSYNTAPGWVDVNRAVRDTLLLLRYELRTREIETVEELESKMPQIWAREAGVRGICMNLMINAVQAMNGGGRLTVTTRHRSELVELSVGDTGPGIAPEHLERIWDPFFTTKPVGQGTGLGLSVSYGIIDSLGGHIGYRRAAAGGAIFYFDLPAASAER